MRAGSYHDHVHRDRASLRLTATRIVCHTGTVTGSEALASLGALALQLGYCRTRKLGAASERGPGPSRLPGPSDRSTEPGPGARAGRLGGLGASGSDSTVGRHCSRAWETPRQILRAAALALGQDRQRPQRRPAAVTAADKF